MRRSRRRPAAAEDTAAAEETGPEPAARPRRARRPPKKLRDDSDSEPEPPKRKRTKSAAAKRPAAKRAKSPPQPSARPKRQAPRRRAKPASPEPEEAPEPEPEPDEPEPPAAGGRRKRKASARAARVLAAAAEEDDGDPESAADEPKPAKRARKPANRRLVGGYRPPANPISPTMIVLRPLLAFLDHGSVLALSLVSRNACEAVHTGHGTESGKHPAAEEFGEFLRKETDVWAGVREARDDPGQMWLPTASDPVRLFAVVQRLRARDLDAKDLYFCAGCACFSMTGSSCYFCSHEPPTKGDGLLRVTKGLAKTTFRLRDQDLQGLDVLWKRNPHYRSAPPMQLFLASELAEAAERRWGSMEAVLEKKLKQAAAKALSLDRENMKMRAKGLDPQAERERIEAEKQAKKRAAAAARRAARYAYYDDGYDSYDYDDDRCWRCGDRGHKRYQCWM